jgi:hypothetical protein
MIVVIILAVIGALIVGWYLDRKRREELAAWALAKGWRLESSRVRGLPEEYPGLKLLQLGHSREGKNEITGTYAGRPLRLIDYTYVTGSGKHRSTHKVGLVIMQTGYPVIPLTIRRENAMDRVGEFFGAGDIDFESAEFSRTFHVTSSDRKWAFDVIHPRAMDLLLRGPAFAVSFGFQEIAVHKSGHFAPADYDRALALADSLYRMIPDYVVQQMKGQPR